MLSISNNHKRIFIKKLLESSCSIRDEVNSLLSVTPINFFHFSRYSNDGNWQGLSINEKTFQRLLEEEYFADYFKDYDFSLIQNGNFFMKDLPMNSREKKYIDECETLCKIGNLFMISKKNKLHCDFYIFGADISLNLTNYYINKLDFMYKMCSIIETKLKDVLRNLPKICLPKSDLLCSPYFNDFKNQEHSLDILNLQLLNLSSLGSNFTFTRREQQCLNYLLKGYSAKQTAAALALSPRTVENHLEGLKEKFFVKTKKEIIHIFEKL